MNIAWCYDWYDVMLIIQEHYDAYDMIISEGFFDPDAENPDPVKAVMWLSREEYLNVCVDMIRDLLWHDLSGRYD